MPYDTLLYQKENGLGIITLNRPNDLNALNSKLLGELVGLLDEIAADETTKVVIITGSGDRAFVAGSDVKEMATKTSITVKEFVLTNRRTNDKIENFPKPVIAAINGYALGGGCELAMSCDLRIASETARFGQPEINLGIIPGAGGTQRLTRLIGIAKAKELIYTGDMIDAATALSLGLVNKVVPAANLMAEAKALGAKLATKSSATLALAKASVNSAWQTTLNTGLDMEMQLFALTFATEDQKEGMGAFVAKRKPQFKDK
jgi:enoyl-CoA hydratase